MKRVLALLCLILLLPLFMAENAPINFPSVNRAKATKVAPPNAARVGSRTLESLKGLG
uniref:LP12023p n=1 Tax=Drosophila melanogaster TaxID=7227 RepID=Q8MS53_DROME|nr:LP12023p [Drosophila melanogaster]